ncbi:Fc receptor-like A isoform X6 [Otolemur garnettii]|uniref:Fc receptor-like A isoform X6 n=1 Tax=Otolemur garnettii TaxID=30611 RepID=UPI0006446354|nr:Fc receptor-like A isoform X6 [Otolemur garnettii]
MKLGCVLTARAFYLSPVMLWAAQMLLGPSSSAASPALNPAPQKSAAPGTPPTPEPPRPLPTSSSEDPSFSSPLGVPDPHLHHQMGILLKHMQDVRVLLGHLVMELRELSGRRKPGTTEAAAK